MNRRTKQIVYGAFYLACWVGIGFVVYYATLKPPASCFDGKMNQDETEVDCGGQFCESCDIRRLLPIRIAGVTLLPTGNADTATALVEFQNPNPKYGAASFKYRLEFFTSEAAVPAHIEEGEAFIYPSEVKYKALPNLPLKAGATLRYAEIITDPVWKSAEALSVPQIQIREIKLARQNGEAVLTGIVRNNSPFPLISAIVNGFALDDNKKIVAASRTSIQDVAPTEERFFQILLPLPSGSVSAELEPRISVEARR